MCNSWNDSGLKIDCFGCRFISGSSSVLNWCLTGHFSDHVTHLWSWPLLILQASNSTFNYHSSLFISTPHASSPPLVCVLFLLCPVFLHTLMQIESFKLNFRENARSRTDHGADIITWPVSSDSPVFHSSVSLTDSLIPRSHTTPAFVSSQEQRGEAGSLNDLRTWSLFSLVRCSLNPASYHC